MQIEAQKFLSLASAANSICFFDSEATGLRADYSHFLVFTIKPLNGKAITFSCAGPGDDRQLVKDARNELEKYALIVGYYSKGFDVPFLNTRLLRHCQRSLNKIHHLDLYYHLKFKTLTSRRSQGHFCNFLGTDEQKMSVSPLAWGEFAKNPEKHIRTMRLRCESDVDGLQQLFERTKHLVQNISV